MNSTEADVELKFEAVVGESPVWDEKEQLLYWIDIVSGVLYGYDPQNRNLSSYEIGESIGAVALRQEGGLVLATASGFSFFDTEDTLIDHIVDPESHLQANRFNDGKCDPAGRFWAGTISKDLEFGAGNLYSLQPDLQLQMKLQDVTISNGMSWNRKRSAFYFIDSPTRQIMQYDYNEESGELCSPTVLREIDEAQGLPDGMAIDEQGGLWIALYDGFKVIRIDPDSGKTLHEVQLPVPKVTSCTFGGPNGDDLYITTAREYMSPEELENYPLSGSLFKVALPVKGGPTFRFAG